MSICWANSSVGILLFENHAKIICAVRSKSISKTKVAIVVVNELKTQYIEMVHVTIQSSVPALIRCKYCVFNISSTQTLSPTPSQTNTTITHRSHSSHYSAEFSCKVVLLSHFKTNSRTKWKEIVINQDHQVIWTIYFISK